MANKLNATAESIQGIGSIFLLARNNSGISLAELERRSQISKLTIGNLERGSLKNVRVDSLLAIAEGLGLKLSFSITSK